jgi:hypothetical protein
LVPIALLVACGLAVPPSAVAGEKPTPERPGAPAGAGLAGTWILEEQSYGSGKANLPPGEEPLFLRIVDTGAGLEARTGRVGREDLVLSWPAWADDEGTQIPIEIHERRLDAAAEVLAARYTVAGAAGPETVLEVEESYHLEDKGTLLVGRVKVTLRSEGEDRGSYVLERRFRRGP